jgi:hypothetical protein
MLEYRDEGRGDEISFFVILCLKDIEADGKFRVRRIKVCDFVRAGTGNEVQDVFDELAVRVYDREAVAATQILYRHVLQKSALARARLSDDVDVMPAVVRLYPKLDAARVAGGFAQRQDFRLKKRPTDL